VRGMRIIVGISGASGAIYGYRLMQILIEKKVEVHLVISPWAKQTIEMELGLSVDEISKLACHWYDFHNLAGAIASGSFLTDGMVIAPCSMKTLAGIAHGYDDNLLIRAASVTLKEQRKLILVTRETPLTPIYLENMLTLARMGVVIMPPIPAFYNKPSSIEEIIDHSIGRVLDHLKIKHNLIERWCSG
jgi:4-hydroxy-3-polyprenylbenzoate decarboxylase